MEELKSLFGDESIDYATFEQKLTESGMKLADIAKGGYIAKGKYDRLNAEFAEYKTANDVSKYADYDALKQENEQLKAEKVERDMYSLISKKNVDDRYAKFVLSEVKGKVTDKVNFETALDEYLKENEQFVKNENPIIRKGASSLDVSGKNSPNVGTNKKMNDFLRGSEK